MGWRGLPSDTARQILYWTAAAVFIFGILWLLAHPGR